MTDMFYIRNLYFIEIEKIKQAKVIALFSSVINLFISVVVFLFFDFANNQFQFVEEIHETGYFKLYLGVDGLSVYFILLTTIITPIALLSN